MNTRTLNKVLAIKKAKPIIERWDKSPLIYLINLGITRNRRDFWREVIMLSKMFYKQKEHPEEHP